MRTDLAIPQVVREENHFIVEVFGWMALGLALTGVIAGVVSVVPGMVAILFGHVFVFYGLVILELILVFRLAGIVHSTMSASMATLMFLFYAAINGLSLSVIFLVYTRSSITLAFLVTAGTFGVMSLYGYVTKTDLTGVGNLCFMALIGMIFASLANLYFQNPRVMWITTYAGILIFVGLTAYDTQKIKQLFHGDEDGDLERKEAVSGALALYLDFINLFLNILRLMGRSRD